jgi:sigma-B regulation protein RsbU (phosphoserine phosphatase)
MDRREGRIDELIPGWLLAVRSPLLRVVVGAGVPALCQIGLDRLTDASASRLGPPLVLVIVTVAATCGWVAATTTGGFVTVLYWYYCVPHVRSFELADGAAVSAVAGMVVLAVGISVLTRQIERAIVDVRGLDEQRQREVELEARTRQVAEHERDLLEKVARLSAALAVARTPQEVAETTLAELDVPARPASCSIALVQGNHLRVLADRGATPGSIRAIERADLAASPWLAEVLTGAPALVDDREAFAADHPEAGVLLLYPRGSWAVLPFRSEATLGLLSLYFLDPQPLSELRWCFTLVAEIVANALERAVAEERQARQLVELESAFAERDRIARTLSTTLLPPTLPTIPGFEASAWLLPARGDEVAGDFYDLFPVGEGDWVAVLGDVCGKGAEAAAVTSLARYAARATALHDPDPARISDVANTALVRDPSDLFCTMVIVRYSAALGELAVTLAGHPQARVVTGGEVQRVGTFARPLGYATSPPEVVRVPFRPGDLVALFTDGVLDRNPSLDEDALEELLAAGGTAAEVAERVRCHLEALPVERPDDAAVLVLRRR